MSIDFGTIPESTEDRRRRLFPRVRLKSLGVQILSAAAAIGIFAGVVGTNASPDTGNVWMAASVLLWITAFTAHVWRRPQSDEGFEVLVFYRRMRRIAWRTSVVLLYAAFVLLWIAFYWHLKSTNAAAGGDMAVADTDSGRYRFFSGTWGWPLAAAAVPILAEPILVRMFARPARDAMRRVRTARAWARVSRDSLYGTKNAGFDFERGASGRPLLAVAGHFSPKLPPSGETRIIRPRAADAPHLSEAQAAELERWWANASLTWTGRRLVAMDADGVETEIPLARDAGPAGAAEIVWFTERLQGPDRLDLSRRLHCCGLLFLDPRGWRIGQMPGLGFTARAVDGVAKAAGLEYAAYDLGGSTRDPVPLMSSRLFPGRRRAVTIKAR